MSVRMSVSFPFINVSLNLFFFTLFMVVYLKTGKDQVKLSRHN